MERVQDQDLERSSPYHLSQPESLSSDRRLLGGLFAKYSLRRPVVLASKAGSLVSTFVVVISYVCSSSRRMYCLIDEPRILWKDLVLRI